MSPPIKTEHLKQWDCGAQLPPGHECPQADTLRDMDHKLDKVLLFIEGDGTEGNPGWKLRLDRLEQWKKTVVAVGVVLGVPMILLIIERVVHWPK